MMKTAFDDGVTEGEYQKAVNSARIMKMDGVKNDVISIYTGLAVDEIEKL